MHVWFKFIYLFEPYIFLMQAQIIKRRNYLWWQYSLLVAKHSLAISWLSHISKEVGFPCYLLLSIFELVWQTHLFIELISSTWWRGYWVLLFKTLIITHELFQSLTVVLCMFHAICQPFKRDIYYLLPSKQSKKWKLIELTKVGRSWDEDTWHILWFMTFYNYTYLFCHDQ